MGGDQLISDYQHACTSDGRFVACRNRRLNGSRFAAQRKISKATCVWYIMKEKLQGLTPKFLFKKHVGIIVS